MGEGRARNGEKNGSVFVLLCILALIVGIVATAGLVMAIMNYAIGGDIPLSVTVDGSDPRSGYRVEVGGSTGGTGATRRSSYNQDMHYDSQIWTIRLNDEGSRLNYIDPRTRRNRGYYNDVINAVCQIAGKNCLVVDDEWQRCFSDGYPQEGLMARWYDACAVFAHSADRARSVMFSNALAQVPRPVFLTKRGNPSGFNPNNLREAKIGLLADWWCDAYCLFSVTDYELQEDQMIAYPDSDYSLIVSAVERGEVDAAFISNDLSPATDGTLEVLQVYQPCLLGGESLMMRRDSLLKSWWDPAFEKLINSRQYREICKDIDDPLAHGNQPGKSASEICVGIY